MTERTKNAPVRVLVVEDETIVALDLKNNLKILGYDVVGTAATGEEAISKARSARPDIVLMDIMLKGKMDGVEAAEKIRSDVHIPVIFLTACADEKTLERAKVSEPFGYLIKPFEERELHSHIEIALYKHRMENQLRESEERYSLATQGSNDGLWDWNLQREEIYFSPRWKSMLGYREGQIGHSPSDWLDRIHPADRERVEKSLRLHLSGATGHFESEYRILDAEGSYRWVLCRGLAQRDEAGKACRIAGSQTDITDRKVYNPLTGLPNRILLMDRIERALKCVGPQPGVFAVAAVEIEGMKAIASSLGHVLADRLMCQVARKMQSALSVGDTVAHFGNDDFVLLLEDVKDGKQATVMAARLLHALRQAFELDGQTVYVTARIGMTFNNHDYACADDMVRDAFTALHRARDEGKSRFEIFDCNMRASAVARLQLEADFRRAMEEKEFKIHFQPIVDLKTGRLAGLEALLRWQRQDRLVYPKDFLGVAESTELLITLERWVLLESCLHLAKWQEKLDENLTLNVNLCPQHYASPQLVKDLKRILEKSGIRPNSLCLEITESALMDNTETVSQVLAQVREMNVRLHMDDFGTGYSSLSYLHRFPIDCLKIDRSFVGNLGLSEETWKIVQAIVNLGRNLEMEIIAEGIENLMQLRMLQTLRCEFGQGYYFARPMEPEAVEDMVSAPLPWLMSFDTNVVDFARARGKT
jgi:diguanylate cyclase (GGDEF)-like protein/PAS domain S-box-containing protein